MEEKPRCPKCGALIELVEQDKGLRYEVWHCKKCGTQRYEHS